MALYGYGPLGGGAQQAAAQQAAAQQAFMNAAMQQQARMKAPANDVVDLVQVNGTWMTPEDARLRIGRQR